MKGKEIAWRTLAGERVGEPVLLERVRFFAPEREVLVFPAWDCLPYDRLSPHPDIVAERLETLAAERRIRAAPFRLLLSPVGVRLLLGVAPRLLPLELEPYLAYHFGKVGVQTRQILGSYLAAASRQGRQAPALRTLLDRLA